MENENPEVFEEWAVLELFGHKKIAGRVSEHVIAGHGFVRVDVPATETKLAYTQLFGPSAIYSIIPTTEDVVMGFLRNSFSVPINRYELQEINPVDDDEDDDNHDTGSELAIEDLPF